MQPEQQASDDNCHIFFPIAIPTCLENIPTSSLPTHLDVVAAKKLVLALYVQIALALKNKDDKAAEKRLRQLMLCSLSVTVRIHLGLSETDKLLEANRCSAVLKGLGNRVADSWLTWSLRALTLADIQQIKLSGSEKCASALTRVGLTYEGKAVNKNQAQCLAASSSLLTPEAVDILKTIERRHGSKPLTSEYTKLLRVYKVVQSHTVVAKSMLSPQEAVVCFLKAALTALAREVVDDCFFTITALDPPHKHGFVSLVLTRCRLLCYLTSLVGVFSSADSSSSACKKEMEDLLQDMTDPVEFNRLFPVDTTQAPATEASEPPVSALESRLECVKHAAGKKLCQLLHDIQDGSHDEALHSLAGESEFEQIVTDPERESDSNIGELVKEIRAFTSTLESSRAQSPEAQSFLRNALNLQQI